MQHQNRVVVVTGGLGGIGRAIAERYVQDGASVAIVDMDAERGEALCAEWKNAGHNVAFAAADVADYHACERAADQLQSLLGPIDTLVNNAGISPKHDGHPMAFHQMDPAEWNRVMNVNLNSAFNWSRILTPGMVERKFGRIVSMSSVAGKANIVDIVAAHYSTTKAALIGFTRHLAGELGPHGITVNALAPGRINTPLLKTVVSSANDDVVKETPLRRLGEPVEVADACLFLTSPNAAFITGQVLDVAGGWMLT